MYVVLLFHAEQQVCCVGVDDVTAVVDLLIPIYLSFSNVPAGSCHSCVWLFKITSINLSAQRDSKAVVRFPPKAKLKAVAREESR